MYGGGLKELLHTNHSCWLLKHAALLNIPSVYLMHSILIKRVYYIHIIFEQNLPRAQLLGKYFLITFIKAFNGLFVRTLILMNIRLKKNFSCSCSIQFQNFVIVTGGQDISHMYIPIPTEWRSPSILLMEPLQTCQAF